MNSTRQTGLRAEQIASDFLAGKGLREIERNFHCRFGEIDIIARHDEHLVFVEVRYRQSNSHGGAAASIGISKQRKLRNSALHYLQRNRLSDAPCRFDVISISGELENPRLDWIRNAF
jgi:putative endonuclease